MQLQNKTCRSISHVNICLTLKVDSDQHYRTFFFRQIWNLKNNILSLSIWTFNVNIYIENEKFVIERCESKRMKKKSKPKNTHCQTYDMYHHITLEQSSALHFTHKLQHEINVRT